MKFGSKDIPFVYKGDKLVYPNPIKDGLLLWYDFKGMRNTDTNKEVVKDLSLNGNDGTLTNFNFTEGSGYKDNTLVFDGVDDNLTIPELALDETAMTVMHDGKLYAYEDDKVLTVGEDGEVVGSGKNLLPSFYDGAWLKRQSVFAISPYHLRSAKGVSQAIIATIVLDVKPNTDYTIFVNTDLGRTRISGDSSTIMGYQSGDFSRVFNTGTNESVEVELGVYSGNLEEEINFSNVMLCQGRLTQSSFTPAPKDYKTTTLSPASLTDLQLYNKTLRKDELLHNAESKGLKKLKPDVVVQDGLILHYDFSHESNTSEYKDKAFDYSGNGNHGVLQNFGYAEGSGYEGKGLKFDGVDDYILSNSLDKDYFDTIKNFNFDFVLNQKDIASKGTIVLMPITGQRLTVKKSEDAIAVGRYTSHWFGKKTPSLKRGSIHLSINVILLGEGEYELNEPSFLIEMYVNGTLVEDVYASSSDYYSNVASVLTIGWQGTDSSQGENAYLNESLHSLKIYNRSLTPEEIAHNYAIEKEKFDIIEGEM